MAKKHQDEVSGTRRESPRARVLRWLERAIASGEIPHGAELPPEREIARHLGVAPNTAAAAMDEAEARGLAIRRRASARKRYAGSLKTDSLAASTVFVLTNPMKSTNVADPPIWSETFLALDVVQRISLRGRHASLLLAGSLPPGGLDAIFEARPGGMVVTGSAVGDPFAMRTLERCRAEGIPVAAYGNAPELRIFDHAYSDHRAGSRDLTRWLLSRGCKRIVPFFPAIPSQFWETERIAGYEEAMREAGLTPYPVAVFGSSELGRKQTEETFRLFTAMAISTLLALRTIGGEPDALLCLNDDWARPALAAIRALGLTPNRDILVAGYDNMASGFGFASFCADAPAVTIDKHNERSAEDLASLIVGRMDGTIPSEAQSRIHNHEVVELTPKTY